MATRYNIAWFKQEIKPQLSGFSLAYRSFGNGDFGSLERVEFESEALIGSFDFWSHGWLDVHVIEPGTIEEGLNVFFGPDHEAEKTQAVTAFLARL